MTLAVTKELASLAWHVIFPTKKNTLAKFHNLAALQLFQVLMCQIWASALAFPQKTYWSTASAVSQAWLSVSHRAPPAGFEARRGTREELSSSVAYSWLPVHPILETLSKSFFAISQTWWYSGISLLKSYSRMKTELQLRANYISLGTSRTLLSSFLSTW